ncbi:hypothetical protein OSB04_023942 [Centaurea solstitialis]|uniref:Uncharacterized protein n=1 Tax=Centaurea solstitialis TaxID=347529 RepID=A0AA38W9W6_9ASTR|nr:hypothetical protein OSB04_023942 [Centaurea solstitialis]
MRNKFIAQPQGQSLGYPLKNKFITRFFPPTKADKIKADIMAFQQGDDETPNEWTLDRRTTQKKFIGNVSSGYDLSAEVASLKSNQVLEALQRESTKSCEKVGKSAKTGTEVLRVCEVYILAP